MSLAVEVVGVVAGFADSSLNSFLNLLFFGFFDGYAELAVDDALSNTVAVNCHGVH